MSRERKYRAWYKGVMHSVSALYFDDNGQLYKVGIRDGLIFEVFIINKIELMDYIGLKDKNGTEIYEEDRIKNEYGDINTVKFLRGSFTNAEDFNNWFLSDCEVIGNTYELLEVKE